MTKKRDQAIRQTAYEIWEAEGRPAGQHEAHWLRAEKLLNDKKKPQKTKKAPVKRKSTARSTTRKTRKT